MQDVTAHHISVMHNVGESQFGVFPTDGRGFAIAVSTMWDGSYLLTFDRWSMRLEGEDNVYQAIVWLLSERCRLRLWRRSAMKPVFAALEAYTDTGWVRLWQCEIAYVLPDDLRDRALVSNSVIRAEDVSPLSLNFLKKAAFGHGTAVPKGVMHGINEDWRSN